MLATFLMTNVVSPAQRRPNATFQPLLDWQSWPGQNLIIVRRVSSCANLKRAVSSRFAALRKVHIPVLSTVHAVLQAGKEPIKIKAKVISRPSAYSSAQIPSSSLAQSPHVPLVLFISSSLSMRLWKLKNHTHTHTHTLKIKLKSVCQV